MVSEKKTALDVVYSRLGNLSQYALLIDDVGNKEAFYQQLSKMVYLGQSADSNVDLSSISENIDALVKRLEMIADELYAPDDLAGNFVSLIAPVNIDAPSMFKWDNPFCWAYRNNVADSMKQQVKKMGPIKNLLGMMPGIDAKALDNADIDERKLDRVEAIIKSMTKKERAKPDIINASRRKRIAAGAGVKVEDVNRLLRQYEQMKKMFKQMNKKGGKNKFLKGMNMPGMPGGPGGFGF